MTTILSAHTYDTLQLGRDEIPLTMDEIRRLPWVAANVAAVRFTRLGIEIQLGGAAGRLVVTDGLVIDVAELVPGTASACLSLSTKGRRQGPQPTGGSRLRISPGAALTEAYVQELLALGLAGRPKQYVMMVETSSRPRGKLLVGATVSGPWARGNVDRVVVRRRFLSEDTPLNRLLLAAAVRSERILCRAESDWLTAARRAVVALSGARLVDDLRDVDIDALGVVTDTREVARMAKTILIGVPVLPPEQVSSSPFTSWVRLDVLFEDAVRSICERVCTPGAVTRGRDENRSLFLWQEGDPPISARRAEPDVAIRHSGRTAVLDAKYRRRGERADEEAIYQLIAHAGAYGADVCALVTPALHSQPSVARLGRTVSGAPVDIISVDPADARHMERSIRFWLKLHGMARKAVMDGEAGVA